MGTSSLIGGTGTAAARQSAEVIERIARRGVRSMVRRVRLRNVRSKQLRESGVVELLMKQGYWARQILHLVSIYT